MMLSNAVVQQQVLAPRGESVLVETSDRFAQFAQYVSTHPHAPRQKLADRFGVTRQTIQTWLRRIRNNQPVLRSGRPAKFAGYRTGTYSIRVPAELLARLKASMNAGDKDVSRQVRRIIEDAAFEALSQYSAERFDHAG